MGVPDFGRLEVLLGHSFQDPDLAVRALSHASYSYEQEAASGNERLEFLGDAVLDLWVAQLLYDAHPDWREDRLTRSRSGLVSGRALAGRARELGLGDFALLGRGEQVSGGRDKDSILANVFEALVGAVYLDGGPQAAQALVERLFGDDVRRAVAAQDAKTAFQEWAHAEHHKSPNYRLLEDSGVENDGLRYRVELCVGETAYGSGVGRSLQAAETAAAEVGLARVAKT